MVTAHAQSAPPTLSIGAQRLLRLLLEASAHRPDRAIKDAVAAPLIGCRERDVIDFAAELIDADWLICATCKPPFGRFVVRSCDDLAPAYEYYRSLRERTRAVGMRSWRIRRAIRLCESHRSPDTRGQLGLWGEAQ